MSGFEQFKEDEDENSTEDNGDGVSGILKNGSAGTLLIVAIIAIILIILIVMLIFGFSSNKSKAKDEILFSFENQDDSNGLELVEDEFGNLVIAESQTTQEPQTTKEQSTQQNTQEPQATQEPQTKQVTQNLSQSSEIQKTNLFKGKYYNNILIKRDIVYIQKWEQKIENSLFQFWCTITYKDSTFDTTIPYSIYQDLPDTGNIVADIQYVIENEKEIIVCVYPRSDTDKLLGNTK